AADELSPDDQRRRVMGGSTRPTRRYSGVIGPGDERRHASSDEELWGESWYFDFAARDASVGGYVRLGLYPNKGVAWWWATCVRPGEPTVLVREHEAPLPSAAALELR